MKWIKLKNNTKVWILLNYNEQNQKEEGIIILTPSHMPSRLPIPLAQLKVGNNSEKLKNELRQLL